MKTLFRLLMLLLIVPVVSVADYTPEARTISYKPARFGDYEVHYSAFSSTFLTPKMARLYNLKRGERYGIVNIAIRNIKSSETGKAVTGDIKGNQINLLTQKKSLEFREIKESDAIYYLAGFQFSGEELLKFSINVTPNGSGQTETIRFEQKFYQEK